MQQMQNYINMNNTWSASWDAATNAKVTTNSDAFTGGNSKINLIRFSAFSFSRLFVALFLRIVELKVKNFGSEIIKRALRLLTREGEGRERVDMWEKSRREFRNSIG